MLSDISRALIWYAPANERGFSFENYSRELTDILKAVIANGKSLEINSSTKSEKPVYVV